MTRELEAISSAATAWPGKLSRFQALARINPEHRVYTQRPDGLYTAPDTGDSRRTLRTPEVRLDAVDGVATGGQLEPVGCRPVQGSNIEQMHHSWHVFLKLMICCSMRACVCVCVCACVYMPTGDQCHPYLAEHI